MCKVVCFDLDDTISKEIDYLNSAYREIARYAAALCKGCSMREEVLAQKAYETMLEAYKKNENTFEVLNVFLGVSNPMSEYLSIYRNHKPEIALSEETDNVLTALKAQGCRLGLITDGRSVQQRNKIDALRLERFFEAEDIVISEEFGSEKPSAANYEYFIKKYPEASFIYVGDNPKKDFVGANALGWNTVCLLDDGRNIHKQEFEAYVDAFQPKLKINTLSELVNLI
nr:HAD family hydrolase [uncultured Bacteroides sp.]